MTIATLTRSLSDVEAEEVAAILREHRHAAPVCDPDNFDAHVAGTAEDGAPIYGSCAETCQVIPV